jgi:hypothetical protein
MTKYKSKSSSKGRVKQKQYIKKRMKDASLSQIMSKKGRLSEEEQILLSERIKEGNLSTEEVKGIIQSDKINDLHFKDITLLQEKLFYDTHSDRELFRQVDEINNFFAPFCHGTSTTSSEQIEDSGAMIPRGIKESTYEGGIASLSDRVYFASLEHDRDYAVHRCIQALEESCKKHGEIPWENGYVYILWNIPEEFYNKVGFDEDAFAGDWYEYDDIEDDDRIRDLFWSVGKSNSVTIKDKVPRKHLERLTAKEFYDEYIEGTIYAKKSWEEFKKGALKRKWY